MTMVDSEVNSRLWNTILEWFPILQTIYKRDESVDIYTTVDADKLLLEKCYIPVTYKCVFDAIEVDLMENVNKLFWNGFGQSKDKFEVVANLIKNVQNLESYTEEFNPALNKLEDLRKMYMDSEINMHKVRHDLMNCMDSFRSMVRSLIFTLPDMKYETIMYDLYLVLYKAYLSSGLQEDEDESQSNCCNCDNPMERCMCKELAENIRYLLKFFDSMGMLPIVARTGLKQMALDQIEQYVSKLCKGNYYTKTLKPIIDWFTKKLDPFLDYLNYDCNFTFDYSVLSPELKQAVYETYTTVGISQLFSLIVEYPESYDAVEDLRRSLEIAQLDDKLIVQLKQDVNTRLLHIGVNTRDILIAYAAAIRALNHLDHTGNLAKNITAPIKLYLKSRQDTVHCVVRIMMEDGSIIDIGRDSLIVGRDSSIISRDSSLVSRDALQSTSADGNEEHVTIDRKKSSEKNNLTEAPDVVDVPEYIAYL